jgi:hypothetical protein
MGTKLGIPEITLNTQDSFSARLPTQDKIYPQEIF